MTQIISEQIREEVAERAILFLRLEFQAWLIEEWGMAPAEATRRVDAVLAEAKARCA